MRYWGSNLNEQKQECHELTKNCGNFHIAQFPGRKKTFHWAVHSKVIQTNGVEM